MSIPLQRIYCVFSRLVLIHGFLRIGCKSLNCLCLIKEADTRNQNFLDFKDFCYFVKMLKRRPEIDRLYHQLCSANGKFDFPAFERFMRELQKVSAFANSFHILTALTASPSPHSHKTSCVVYFQSTPPFPARQGAQPPSHGLIRSFRLGEPILCLRRQVLRCYYNQIIHVPPS